MAGTGEAPGPTGDRVVDERAGTTDGWPAARSGPLPIGLVVLASVTVVEIVRQGAFYPADAFAVAVVSLVLIVSSLVVGVDRRALGVVVAVGACAAWWMVSAERHSEPKSFLPLGASMLGFLAAFLVVRRLGLPVRQFAAVLLATIGAGAAAIGLAASLGRRFPLAMPAQDLWRLSTTLTYADAAGLLLGMALLVGLALDPGRWYLRADVALCAAGLVATQSRGAVLAAVVGLLFVPWSATRAWTRPLLAGLAAGLVVVGTSSGPATQPWAAAAVGVVLLGGVVRLPIRLPRLTPRRALVTVGCAVVAVVVVVAALHTPIERRIELNSTGDRMTEWTAAADQWRSAPWLGVGPDALLRFHAVDGTFAHFAHNEYLQVLADAGAVGALLLLASAGTVVAAVRREDVLTSCATGALVAFAVAGALDFDWHLAALGVVGGWVTGLAGRPRPDPGERASTPD